MPRKRMATVRQYEFRLGSESNAPVKVNYGYCTSGTVSLMCSIGGWDSASGELSDELDKQIEQAFSNVDLTLRTAGVEDGWKQVSSVKSYHVGEINEHLFEVMKQNMEKWMAHKPIWTMMGVTALGLPAMKVEIDVVAIEDEGKKSS
ncbi:hypothetical protein LTR15_006036 [Elasticomyces elasticus]|nr:hypothetical protein LTR15_006036 [Elasticomyces elasticus]